MKEGNLKQPKIHKMIHIPFFSICCLPLSKKVSVAVSPAPSNSSYSFKIFWTYVFIFPQISEVEMGRTSTEARLHSFKDQLGFP